MPEKQIIQHCAPTLAGLKTANLFTLPLENKKQMLADINDLNHRLQNKGVRVLLLGETRGKALIYFYRPDQLKADLQDDLSVRILTERGYRTENPNLCLGHLISKLKNDASFPHEIGCFLGYPSEDVLGFIENKGPCKCIGSWKVYGDEEKARSTFAKYKSCVKVLLNQYEKGKSLEYLTVG